MVWSGSARSRSARRWRRCCRASASRPSACRSCRRCTAARPDRPARCRRSGRSGRSSPPIRSAERQRVGHLGGGAASARILRQRRHDDVLDAGARRAMPSASGASRSSVIRILIARIGRDVEQLARGVDRVDVDDDGAESQGGERRDDVLRAVRQHDADAIALHDPRAAAARPPADRCAVLISPNVSVAPRNAVAGASGISAAVVDRISYSGRVG